jgi:hypothetical protein
MMDKPLLNQNIHSLSSTNSNARVNRHGCCSPQNILCLSPSRQSSNAFRRVVHNLVRLWPQLDLSYCYFGVYIFHWSAQHVLRIYLLVILQLIYQSRHGFYSHMYGSTFSNTDAFFKCNSIVLQVLPNILPTSVCYLIHALWLESEVVAVIPSLCIPDWCPGNHSIQLLDVNIPPPNQNQTWMSMFAQGVKTRFVLQPVCSSMVPVLPG